MRPDLDVALGIEPVVVDDAVARFLTALFPGSDGFIELRAFPTQRFFPVGDVAGVAAFLYAHAENENVYHGCATRRSPANGTLENCLELHVLWVDCDFKTTPEAEVRTRLATFPIPPHVIVQSGHGLHVYWRLREPFTLPAEAPAARAILRRLALHFGADLVSAEPAHILRPPSSRNHKYDPPRDVVLEQLEDGAVNASELAEWVPTEPKRPNGSSGDPPFTVPPTIRDGERNDLLYRTARSMHAKQFSAAAIRAALTAENLEKCAPPLPQEEVDQIAAHAATQPDREDFAADGRGVDDAAPFEVSAIALLARVREAPPITMAIDGLVPHDGMTLFHAQPRALKTWCALDCGLALTTGTPALGILPVTKALPVLYLTNEDAWHVVGRRLDALLRGRGLRTIPEPFGFAVHAGVWLDDPAWQARLIARIRAVGYRVLMLDPLRSLTGCVDQGPRELQPFARYLRRLIDETGVVLVLSHHDTKPLLGQRETRQRPQRVSGGGVFSIADAPIHCERLGEDDPAVSLIVPTLWKVCETPAALRVRLTWDADGARLTARALASRDAAHLALDEQLLSALRQQAEASTRALAAIVHADRSTVTARLERLAEAGSVDSRPGAKRATLWFLREAR